MMTFPRRAWGWRPPGIFAVLETFGKRASSNSLFSLFLSLSYFLLVLSAIPLRTVNALASHMDKEILEIYVNK